MCLQLRSSPTAVGAASVGRGVLTLSPVLASRACLPLFLAKSGPAARPSSSAGMGGESQPRGLVHSFHDVCFVNIWLTFSI